jgi:hypothetical protein
MPSVTVFNGFSFGVDSHTLNQGSGSGNPQLSSATGVDHSTFRVVFNRDMNLADVMDISNWSVVKQVGGQTLVVVRVVQVSQTTFDLITEYQEAVNYEATVAPTVRDSFGNTMNPSFLTQAFLGQTPDSSFPVVNNLYSMYGLDGGMQEQQQTDFVQDEIAPTVENADPAPLDTGEAQAVIIQFDLVDNSGGTGIDLANTQIFVEGVLAYNGATDLFSSPYNDVGSSRAPIAEGHHFAIDKGPLYELYKTISVRVVSQDLAGIPNTLDTTYTFQIIDDQAPVLNVNDPVPSSTGNDENDNLDFDLTDNPGSGVDLTTLDLVIDGDNAIVNGVFQSGYDGAGSVATPDGSGGYNVVVDRTTPYDSYKVINATISVEDNEGNALNFGWNWQIQDYLGPLVTPIDPVAGQLNAGTDTNVQVKIEDEVVVVGGFQIEIDPGTGFETAFVEGAVPEFKPNWDGPGSVVSLVGGVYTVTIDPVTDFGLGQTVQVRITAFDNLGNPARL